MTVLPSVSVVMVTYNSEDWIGRSLEALLGGATKALEVVVVDNASTDKSVAVVERVGGAISVPLEENVGFARACNVGAARATGEYLLFLNPDTEVGSRSTDRAVSFLADHPGVGIVGGRTLFEDGAVNATCCFREPSLWSAVCYAIGLSSVFRNSGVFNAEHMGNWDRSGTRAVDVITGCFMMMRRALFEDLGGFDERFFMYSEDTDLCRRVRDRGLACVHVGDVELVHAGGTSDKVRASKIVKVLAARCQYYDKHWTPRAARLGTRLVSAAVFARLLAHSLLLHRGGRARWSEIWAQRARWESPPSTTPSAEAVEPGRPGRDVAVYPPVQSTPKPVITRARLVARWGRHTVQSFRSGDFDFARQGACALFELPVLTVEDMMRPDARECNVCGWRGARFYANTGPGYDERDTLCPGCSALDRHRSLLALLVSNTTFFEPGTRIVEVAPMRGFEALVQRQPGLRYTSFDLSRHAMEHGDITAMQFESASVDYFVCFHVLEHVADEHRALSEIERVLKPGGVAVLQVPVDWELEHTYEYAAPDPREVGHVRRYGRDFGDRLQAQGYTVISRSVVDSFAPAIIDRFGLSPEPIFFVQRADG